MARPSRTFVESSQVQNWKAISFFKVFIIIIIYKEVSWVNPLGLWQQSTSSIAPLARQFLVQLQGFYNKGGWGLALEFNL